MRPRSSCNFSARLSSVSKPRSSKKGVKDSTGKASQPNGRRNAQTLPLFVVTQEQTGAQRCAGFCGHLKVLTGFDFVLLPVLLHLEPFLQPVQGCLRGEVVYVNMPQPIGKKCQPNGDGQS